MKVTTLTGQARKRCAVCGRTNSLVIEWTDTDTGRSGWACWRRSHKALVIEMIESGAAHIRLRNPAQPRDIREADRQARELGERAS